MDELLEKGSILPSGLEREAVYVKVWHLINEIEPWNMISNFDNIFAKKKNLKGIVYSAYSHVAYVGTAYFE